MLDGPDRLYGLLKRTVRHFVPFHHP
jgi:hypothetical protein